MRKIIAICLFLSFYVVSYSQVGLRCPVCAPKQGAAADSSCLKIVNGVAVWLPCAGGTNSFWSLTGNAGTTAGTNFIGTTDSKDLYFKTKNTTVIVVDTNQNVGIGTNTPAYGLDIINKSVNFNYNAVGAVVTQYTQQDAGILINAVGTTGTGHTAYLNIDTGGYVQILGSDSMYLYSTKVIVPSGNVGIGTTEPSATLHVTGNFRLVDGTQSAGYVLTSDADGNASWAIPQYVTDTSSIANLNLSVTKNYYSFFGTTATWTLPAVSGNTGKSFMIKNRGSGSITLNSDGGGNDIYNTSATNSLTITAGSSYILVNDGTYWTVN